MEDYLRKDLLKIYDQLELLCQQYGLDPSVQKDILQKFVDTTKEQATMVEVEVEKMVYSSRRILRPNQFILCSN